MILCDREIQALIKDGLFLSTRFRPKNIAHRLLST